MDNPSLLETPQSHRARVLPTGNTISILDWLKQEGRLIDAKPQTEAKTVEEDISVLMGEDGGDDYKDDFNDN
ncbi:MAG: DUF3134 family protein [Cyanobacteria bacterium J06639_1]